MNYGTIIDNKTHRRVVRGGGLAYRVISMIKLLWYGTVGESWWRETDELCGTCASVRDRLEATREFL